MAFVGFAAALGGGILRDLTIGAVPPLAFGTDPRAAMLRTASAIHSGGVFVKGPPKLEPACAEP